MATNTAPVSPPTRQDPRQVTNTLKKTVNFGDVGLSTGVAFANSLPMGAFITGVWVEIVTAFNAGTTNPLTVGTVSTAYNNIANTTDVNAGATGVYIAGRGLGRALTAAAEITPFVKYAPTGTAATTGQAVIVIEFEGGFLS
jgi:hypothetical protein